MLPLSTLCTRALLPLLAIHLSVPLHQHLFLTSFGHTNLMSTFISSLNINVCHCGNFFPRSRVSHITAPASTLTCFPRLNLSNLPHPGFFLLVTPFSCSCSFCPVLSSHGGEFFFYFKAVRLHEQGKRTLYSFPASAAICLLDFYLSVGATPTACTLPRSSWHHACT